MLRQHTAVWLQVVIWLTIVSLFLTVIGAYVGIRQFRFRWRQRRSPYRGWGLWHHYAGLVFGLFTLTWLVSGLFSVNPWGALEGRSFANEAERLRVVAPRLRRRARGCAVAWRNRRSDRYRTARGLRGGRRVEPCGDRCRG